MISLDTETTGVDFHHGSRPFFLTTCDEDKAQRFWEWPVNPLTREPEIPEEDIDEIAEYLSPNETGGFVLQNSKFDVAALAAVRPEFGRFWRWDVTDDTLIAGHLLASNQPHDLTSMTLMYLGIDIEPLELNLEQAVKEARRMVQQAKLRVKRARKKVATDGSLFDGAEEPLAEWRIAEEGLEEMPSAKGGGKEDDRIWKFDTWLPKALAEFLGHPDDHPWRMVLSDYGNADSAVTLPLWKAMEAELHRKGLWEIYLESRKKMRLAYDLYRRGATLSHENLRRQANEYTEGSAKDGRVCVNIAASYGYELEMPKGASPNNSLRTFCFDVLKLPPIYNPKAKSEAPTLNKEAMREYLVTLPTRSRELTFIKALLNKRRQDTSLSYLEAYQRFWIPTEADGWYRIHFNFNPTGTDTLRWSSKNPNGQNISKQSDILDEGASIRSCFGPAPGREWWSLDAKNIELRLPAYESGEKDLIALFKRPDDPPYYGSQHILNFSTVYPDIWEQESRAVGLEKVGPFCKKKYAATWYQWCKNGDFAIQYNCGRQTADRAFHRRGCFDALKSRFSRLEALNQKCITFAEKHGYVETIPDRSVNPKRGYPLLCTRTERGSILNTIPLSYRTQGSAMWWTCKAMTRCQERLDEWNAEAGEERYWIALQVHDELVFDFPAGSGPEPWLENLPRIRELQRLMEKGGEDYGIPTPVGVEYNALTWGEGKAV